MTDPLTVPLGAETWKRVLRQVYRSSPRDVVGALRKRMTRQKDTATQAELTPPDATFLRSPEYAELMARHLPFDGSHDLHEAQNETQNFRFRHHTAGKRLGVFRWRGIQRHLDTILGQVTPGRRVIDFGGAGGPLGLGSEVVDQLARDVRGRRVPHQSLAGVGDSVDVVFSSHALEHIEALDDTLRDIHGCLKPEGHLILHVPSFHCERWRAGVHTNRRYNDHVWTFGIGTDPCGVKCRNYVDIDRKVRERFDVQRAEYCGDDSILILGRKS